MERPQIVNDYRRIPLIVRISGFGVAGNDRDDGEEPLRMVRVTRLAAWSLAGAIVVLSLVPAALRPQTGLPHKGEHFLIFALTGVAFGLSYEARHGLLALQLVIFAAAVEIAQRFVPGRHARLSDFIVDATAIAGGSIAAALAKQVW